MRLRCLVCALNSPEVLRLEVNSDSIYLLMLSKLLINLIVALELLFNARFVRAYVLLFALNR